MELQTRRAGESDAIPSAKFLQARITALSTTLIKRVENIFAVALDESQSVVSNDGAAPPSLTDTAVQQYQLDIESSALVRTAEEIMILTRSMKEIWLFGDLHTLNQDEAGQDGETKRKIEEDSRIVEEGFKAFLKRYDTGQSLNSNDTG